MHSHWLHAGGTAVLAALASGAAAGEQTEEGILWETTAQMEIPGLPVKTPAYSSQYCAKEQWTKPPETSRDSSQECRHTNFRQTPDKVTWTMICDNPPMTGEGVINFDSADTYTGVVQMHAEQVAMKINLSGRKLGTCDNPE